MIRRLLHTLVRRFERRHAYDAAYLHEILDASLPAFLAVLSLQVMGAQAAGVSPAARFAARFAAVRREDCGPCAQLAIDVAREEGVPPAQLRAVVERDFAALAADTELALRFAEAVVECVVPDALATEAQACFGTRGRITLACAIVTARAYPVLKRALGHAQSCTRPVVDRTAVTPPGQRA